ncbi:MAG: hypothetical protein P1U89_22015 [Verrucomicrobiales bacterium]|nr:hypothetical protein [Verrucomicrobiales bacterium]
MNHAETSAHSDSTLWIPTSNWCGRLILPEESDRKDDGSIFVELLQVPGTHHSLKGETFRLRLDAEWTDRVSVSIKFGPITRSSMKTGTVHPERLDGWDRVSPLESLIGAHPENDVLVELVDPVEEGDYLVIQKEPVQISGSQRTLARFVNQNPDGKWTIQHWNRNENEFTGPTEIVAVTGRETLDPTGGEKLNAEGWYLYSDTDESGTRVVRGIEPRSLFRIKPDLLFVDEDTSLGFLKYRNWRKDKSIKGETSQIHLYPSERANNFQPKPGDKALLLHLFGGVAGKIGRKGGHFSFGMAEVVTDPFTGELRLQIEYKQIYVNNVDGLIPGSSQWHCYMGDTTIGKLEIRPVCDYLIFIPELFDETLGESAYTILERKLAEMTARYRTGEGDGLSLVSSAQNCSQDSSQALYAAIRDWEVALKAGELPSEIKPLCVRLREHITPLFGLVPWAWKRTAKRQPARPPFFRILPAIKSWKTIVPRSNSDGLAETFVRSGRPMILLRSEMVGSTDKDLNPAPPMRPW